MPRPRVYCAVYGCLNSSLFKPEISFFRLVADLERMPGVYCVVYGCFNSAMSKPQISYFRLPTDGKRCSEWLRLVSREDLINKSTCYYVCEEHFNTQAILPGPTRKRLKKNSLPSLKLPNIFKKDSFVQTEAAVKLSTCDHFTQTSSSSNYSRRNRKLKHGIHMCKKSNKSDKKSEKCTRDTFYELCDTFLTEELAELVKAQTYLKCHYTDNRYTEDYKQFCLDLFYTSPQTYRFLQSALGLLCPNTLKKHRVLITTEINDKVMALIKTKVDTMTDLEKNCSIIVDSMSFKTNLYYNIKQDRIIGFHEINGVQTPRPARNALVLMVRGIFNDWKQPVGFALLSECKNYKEITKWIDTLLEKLLDIGLKIRTFVSDIGSDLYNAAEERSITIEKPYFFVNNRKIYYIFDVPHLIKLVHNSLMLYNIQFLEGVAKYEHIVQFYNQDKQKNFKLAHKLTNSHMFTTNFEQIKTRYSTQLFSNSVAAGLSIYIDFNVISESGRDTAKFVKIMNDVFDTLNSSNIKNQYEYKRAFCGTQQQISFLTEMLTFFENLKLIDPSNGNDVTSNIKFMKGFQITIKSILSLYNDLKLEGCNFLLTRRLNQNVVKTFFGQIRTKSGEEKELTSRQFISVFQKLFISNIIKPPKTGNCENDLEKVFIEITEFVQQYDKALLCEQKQDMDNQKPVENIRILSTEYNELDLPEKDTLLYVCSYLLKKCSERHKDCEIFNEYIRSNENKLSVENLCTEKDSKKQDNNQLVVPPDDLVQFIEKMNDVFRSYFERHHINVQISSALYDKINKINYILPCPCFPIIYLKKLFIRLRIFYTIRFNNRAFKTSLQRQKYFSVNNM